MAMGLLGKKLGMTQIFDDQGQRIGVSVVRVGPCVVTQIKHADKDGYNAVQLGLDDKKRPVKAEQGHAAKASTAAKRFTREFRVDDADEVKELQPGQVLNAALLEKVKWVKVTGISKGKGFAGVIKRHGFKGAQTMSHGTHENFRHGGSIGQNVHPGRVFKGKKMAGQLGNKRVTVKQVQIVQILPEEDLVLLKGALPGANNAYLMLEKGV